jgi:hypothetical protein
MPYRDVEIRDDVVDHEDAGVGHLRQHQVLAALVAFEIVVERHQVLHRVAVDDRVAHEALAHVRREGAALSVDALHRYAPAHHLDEVLADGQAESRSFDVAIARHVEFVVFGEQTTEIFLAYAYARIADSARQPKRVAVATAFQGQRDFALARVFEGVGEEVVQHLLDAQFVAKKPRGQIVREFQRKFDGFAADAHDVQAHRVVDHAGEIVFGRNHLEAPGFYLGNIEEIVYDAQQRISRILHFSQIFQCAGRQILAHFEFSQTYDGGERRADFVRNAGEKFGLGLHRVGGLLLLLAVYAHLEDQDESDEQAGGEYGLQYVDVSLIIRQNGEPFGMKRVREIAGQDNGDLDHDENRESSALHQHEAQGYAQYEMSGHTAARSARHIEKQWEKYVAEGDHGEQTSERVLPVFVEQPHDDDDDRHHGEHDVDGVGGGAFDDVRQRCEHDGAKTESADEIQHAPLQGELVRKQIAVCFFL